MASFAAAAEAELLPIHQRLVAEAERAAAARNANGSGQAGNAATEAADADANTTSCGADEEPPSEQPTPEEPRPGPRESARARQLRVLRSKWLEFYPQLAEALTAGLITVEHADALAAIFERTPPCIVAEFDEAWLVIHARTYPPEGFASFIRDEIARIRHDGGESEYQRQLNDSYAWMGIDKTSGMYLLKLAIDPHRGAQLQSAIDQRITFLKNQPGGDKLRWAQLCLQAVWDLIMEGVTITPDSIVVVDHQTATTGRQHHLGQLRQGRRLRVQLGTCRSHAAVPATGDVRGLRASRVRPAVQPVRDPSRHLPPARRQDRDVEPGPALHPTPPRDPRRPLDADAG